MVVLGTALALAGAACSSDSSDATPTTLTPPTTVATGDTTATDDTSVTSDTSATETSNVPWMEDIVGTALMTNYWNAGVTFTELAGLVVDAGLIEPLRGGPFTVFAPTDDAFKKLPLDILHTVHNDPDMLTTVLLYHVVEGAYTAADLPDGELMTLAGVPLTVQHMGDVTYINGNAITLADVEATNGRVHVMSDVLVPACCGDIVDTAVALPGFGTLVDLVTAADLVDTLKGDGPFTVFAPTDDALAKLPADIVEFLVANPDALTTVLTYHVLPGKVNLADLPEGDVETVAGPPIHVMKMDGVTYVNGNPVLVGNVNADNGIIHVIGDALVPPLGDIIDVATTLPGFGTLASLVTAADLVDTLKSDGPFTVFAPTDDALAKLPADIVEFLGANPDALTTVLTYHVLPGKVNLADLPEGDVETVAGPPIHVTKMDGVTYINGNPVLVPNVEATNGIIHVIGDALVPPLGDIIDVATTLPGFTTLATLVTQAELIETLKGDGPFTVFAPTDGAFAALPAATLDAVGSDPELLATVLTYHVVAGKLTTADLVDGKLTTVAGIDLTISHDEDGTLLIDGNPIAVQNVEASNGIIQVMGDVLVPES